MRKDSNSEQTNEADSSNPWAIGTKFVSKNITKDLGFKQNQGSSQTPKNTQNQYFAQQQQQHKHIPKLKERNPFSALKALKEDTQEQQIMTEIKSLMNNFNIQQYSICEFVSEAVKLLDARGLSSFEMVEFILSQTKTKEYFRDLQREQIGILVGSLLNSLQSNLSYQNRDSCVKLLGHLLFEQNDFDNALLQKIYQQIQKICFDTQQQLTGSSGTSSSSQSKTQRLAINCLANILSKSTQFTKDNSEVIFNKLKSQFEYLMRKITLNFKSKRFISMLTTVIRALQLSMNENPKMSTLNDTESIKLYIHFYKLLFLGSPFAEKMLNIKLEETKPKKGKAQQQISQQEWGSQDEEELKGDSGSFIIDTSEMSSSDGGGAAGEHGGSKGKGKSPSSNDSITSSDPYLKVKNFAALCIQCLLKVKNKSLFNYWYLLFPSFFLRSPTEFTPYLSTFQDKKQEYYNKLSVTVTREPSIFYLLKSKDSNTKLKQTFSYIISVLLENSIIQKWQDQLETEDCYQQQLSQASFVSISNYLGQFLRYLHYQMLFMIETEVDPYLLANYAKVAGTLLNTTPYSKMNNGLASLLVEKLIRLNSQFKNAYGGDADTQVKQSISQALSIAFNLNEIRSELDHTFFSHDSSQPTENLFVNLISPSDKKQDKQLQQQHHYQQQKDHHQHHHYQWVDTLNLLQKLCKNYPNRVVQNFEPHVYQLIMGNLKSYDRKKITAAVNVIEEWIKNYKSSNLEEGEEEESKALDNDKDSPYQIGSFVQMMRFIVDQILFSKSYSYSDVNISILSLLCNLQQSHWIQVLSDDQTRNLLYFMENQAKHPPLLKAASLKLLGYLVYYDHFFQNSESTFNFRSKAFQMIFESASDTNQNVQIRNSWALANVCCINSKNISENNDDEYIIKETLIASVNYAMSSKEKISSNGIRALGYFLAHIDLAYLKNEIFSQINKSKVMLARLNPDMFSQFQKGMKQQDIDMEKVMKVIISNLDNKSPKISWNACVAISNILENKSLKQSDVLFSKESLYPLLSALTSRPNFKTKIHAAQTLQKFLVFKPFTDQVITQKFWETLLNSLEQLNQLKAPSVNDQKYVQALELNLLSLWEQLASINEDLSLDQLQSQSYDQALSIFLNNNSLPLLTIITDYLRKELKIPLYSEMYDQEILQEETESLFEEAPNLEVKLQKLKSVIVRVRDTIKQNDKVHVSFGVYEAFNTLANGDIKQYRAMELLKGVKSNFQPSFEDSKYEQE